MKKIIKFNIVLLTLSCSLLLQSCIVAGIGAGIAAVKYGNSKKHSTYNQYYLGMEQINVERAKDHLKPEPILSYKEYCNSQK